MMSSLLVIVAVVEIAVGGLAIASTTSDIQIIVALLALGFAFIHLGMVGVLNAINRIARSDKDA